MPRVREVRAMRYALVTAALVTILGGAASATAAQSGNEDANARGYGLGCIFDADECG
jgi:hypothetical protein